MGRGQCFSIPKDEISLLEIRSKIERQGVPKEKFDEDFSFFCYCCGLVVLFADNRYDGLIGNEPWRATIERNGSTIEVEITPEN